MPEVTEHGARPKTYKREIASAVLAAYITGVVWTLYQIPLLEHEWQAQQMVSTVVGLAFPVMGLVAGVFGLDGYAKQIRGHDYAGSGHSAASGESELLFRRD